VCTVTLPDDRKNVTTTRGLERGRTVFMLARESVFAGAGFVFVDVDDAWAWTRGCARARSAALRICAATSRANCRYVSEGGRIRIRPTATTELTTTRTH
jgi:hypothetical protein